MTGWGASDVSVIVAAGRPQVAATLASLEAQVLPGRQVEIIVVADAGAAADLASGGHVRVVRCETRNPAAKRNLGVRQASAPIVAFIDDDAAAPPDWLARGLALLEARDDVAGVGGPNLPPPDASPAQEITDLVLNMPVIGAGSPAYSDRDLHRPARVGELHLVNLFVRRPVWEAVGGLNVGLGYGCEDSEFIYHARRRGAVFLYDSNLAVWHARRPFGLAYVRQRFRLRANNGRLMWAYPGLYLRRWSFLMVWAGLAGAIALAVLWPVGLALAATAYLAAVLTCSLIVRPRRAPVLAGALIVHHLTYTAGLVWGALTGLLNPRRIARLRRRSA